MNGFFRKAFTSLLLTVAGFSFSKAQLVVSDLPPYNSASYLVQNVLLGTGISVSNITFCADTGQMGFFNGLSSNIGIDSGILMTSGWIGNAVGPNNIGSQTAITNNTCSDPDLTAICTATVNDANILEFDFIPYADTVRFKYVFASEEYPEWVNSTFNDVFGFFISGPGINGIYTNNADNIALVPNTSIPVAINNVNNGSNDCTFGGPNGPCMNCAYYVDNCNGTSVQYDGFTTVLTAQHVVQCGQTYHIKMAICDAGDEAYDSGVFLAAGSFTATSVQITTNISYGGPNDSTLYEGCGQACLVFDRGTANLNNTDTVQLNISGTAINGTDIVPMIPSQLIFQVGQDSIVLCFSAPQDNITEGIETLNITAVTGTGLCQNTTQATIYISDYTPLTLAASNDTSICTGGTVTISANVANGVQPYTYLWSPGGQTSSSITVSPTVNTTYTVAVTDSCNSPQKTEAITVYVVPPATLSAVVPDYNVCLGDTLMLSVTVTGSGGPFYYVWTTLTGNDSVQNPLSQNPHVIPTGNGSYQVTVSDACGDQATDQFVVALADCEIYIPNVISPNGDGMNDVFYIRNIEHYPGSRLKIFNRWGNVLLDDPDYKNTWNGKNAPDGTYFFVLTLSDGRTFPGNLTILRHK